MQFILPLFSQYVAPFVARHAATISGVGLLGKAIYDVSVGDFASSYHDLMFALSSFGVSITSTVLAGHLAKK